MRIFRKLLLKNIRIFTKQILPFHESLLVMRFVELGNLRIFAKLLLMIREIFVYLQNKYYHFTNPY